MGRPKKIDEVELTPEETVFKLVLRMIDIRLTNESAKTIFNIALAIKEKGSKIELGELLQYYINDYEKESTS